MKKALISLITLSFFLSARAQTFTDNGTSSHTFDSIGIGVSNHRSILDVRTSGKSGILSTFLSNESISDPSEVHKWTIRMGRNYDYPNRTLDFGMVSDNHGQNPGFYIASKGVEVFRVTEHGNVGIGTSSPSDKLQVLSTGYNNIFSIGRESTSQGNKFEFVITSHPNGSPALNSRSLTLTAIDHAADIAFKTKPSGSDPQLVVNKDGKVGIGTTSPSAKLHIEDNTGYAFGTVISNDHSAGHGVLIQGGGTNGNRYILQLKDAIGNDRMTIHDTGEIGIGTTSTGSYKLAVEGSIGAREIKVEASGWSDFVFEEGYDLPTLEEVEEHIAEKGHLPSIPSEAEVKENGINLGEMNAKLLQKIEELTLYLIEQNKEIKTLKAEIQELKAE